MPVQPNGTAPYAPPSAVTDVINQQRERGIVSPVTAATLVRFGVSESLTKRVLQAMRLLDFMDENGNLTAEFEDLRKVPTPEFKPRLADMLRSAYADVFTIVDPSGATLEQIHDAFRTLEPAGQRDRMITLFLGLLEYTGEWPNLPNPRGAAATGQAARNHGGRQRPPAVVATPRKGANTRTPPPPPPPPLRNTSHSQTVLLPSGGSITLTVDVNPLTLKGPERAFFYELVDKLDEYATEPSGG